RCRRGRAVNVAIVGGHGKVARRLARLLVARGDHVRGLIRNPDHAHDLRADGVEPVMCDVERADFEQLAVAIGGAEAVVFAAGAGPGSGPERKWTIDRDGAVKLIEAARADAIDRYVMISSTGAENPPSDDDVFSVYLRAKAEADRALMGSGLEWTIVRPGLLTDDPGSGRVRISMQPVRTKVARDDVAAALAAIVHEPDSAERILYVGSGDEPIEHALTAALAQSGPPPSGRAGRSRRSSRRWDTSTPAG
ncbi:MAG: SDR family oxidoreductase, partial [Solirubrobacteraceae bacterium]